MTTGLEYVGVGMMIFWTCLGVAILGVAVTLTETRKSQKYRKTLMDMYVAAKIKFLAKEDGLDIVEEFESFKKWTKKQDIRYGDLDNVIENEIKEQVAEPTKETKK